MQARTKGTSARTPWGHLQPPMRRRVPAGAFSRACTVVNVIFPASLTRRGSAERPRDGSPRPTAESGLDIVNRCMVFQDVASDGASIDGTLRDANGRPWPAGPATALPSTEATTVAKTARADGQMGQRADSNERVRPTGGAGQDSRAGGLYASTRLTGPQRPSGRRHASPVEWPAAAPTSNDFGSDAILARDKPPRSVPSRRDRS